MSNPNPQYTDHRGNRWFCGFYGTQEVKIYGSWICSECHKEECGKDLLFGPKEGLKRSDVHKLQLDHQKMRNFIDSMFHERLCNAYALEKDDGCNCQRGAGQKLLSELHFPS